MRMRKLLLLMILLSLIASGCQARWVDPKSAFWGDDAVFYQVFVRSFADSDGDGTGDFNGLTAKLDYLNDGNPETETDLGVTGIWLMPIFPSPSYHGYDVTDYLAVNPQYGTLDDFRTLVAEAHKRGIRIIIDFVINHTSRQHPWFLAAEAGQPPYRDYYIWSQTNPGYAGPWQQQVWHPSGGAFYYGVFDPQMPDLNYRNPAVTAEVQKITTFWLQEIGIDGFRVDGAKHLLEEQQNQENTASTHAWMKDWHAFTKGVKADALVIGEVWSDAQQSAAYVNDGELDLVFNFTLAEDILGGVANGSDFRIANGLESSERAFDPGSYAPFLSNHDQTRSMTRLGGDVLKAKAAAAILLASPGTPFIYYGEEIGMRGDKPDPNLRRPMQWTAGENAGFTSGDPWAMLGQDSATVNVEAQMADSDSLLSRYRKLIRIRGAHSALRSGAVVPVSAEQDGLVAILRSAPSESVLVLVNLSGADISAPAVSWELPALHGRFEPVLLMGSGRPAVLSAPEGGSVTGFVPLDAIGANETIIIQYR